MQTHTLARACTQVAQRFEHAVVGTLGHDMVQAEVLQKHGVAVRTRPRSALLPTEVRGVDA